MSGIIATIVGGIVVSLFGGSYVTISGPGNGLVVVVLTSIISLGQGDLYLGYIYTLAAIVIAGLCITALGFLRLGNLSDFFPSATIQGMLSAIGLIIIAKQIHVMLGVSGIESSNNLLLLVAVPNSILYLFKNQEIPWAGIIGLLSFGIMFFYSKIRSRTFQLIPAPMWIVLIAVGFYYYFDLISSKTFPIALEYLIQIPANINDVIVFADFGKIGSGAFLISVISITLIASIESLLSIKAVDKLDVYKRRSNVNKDLKALGIATTISGLIGGLPVVAVIARSSVNVNQGAISRKANLFHAVFVCLFIVLFSTLLNKIPLSALAGILVFTGYKLASPDQFRKMYRLGKDQFLIFILTLIATLLFGLINGIILGILITFIIQFYLMENRFDFIRKPFRPNTLMYEEEDGSFHLSVKGQSSFLNFLTLKKKIDSIPPNKRLILDFSLTTFVDNSVMEHIHDYSEDFKKKGSDLEVVGLDIHDPTSSHPFAARRLIKLTSFMKKGGILTNRQQRLKEFAKEVNWKFKTNSVAEVPDIEDFPFFKAKTIDHAYNTFYGDHEGLSIRVMDIEFYEGEFIAREKHKYTVLLIDPGINMPKFRLDKERIFDKIAALAWFQEISIEGHEDFSKRFSLKGEDEKSIRQFFSNELILFFESHPYYHVESNGNKLLVFKSQRVASLSEIKALISYGKELSLQLMLKRLLVKP